MSTATPPLGAPHGAATSSPLAFLTNRSLTRFPSDATRYSSLAIVVLTTVVLYYQLYLVGGVATDVLRDLNMSFVYFVNISVVGYLLGATASVLAGLADRYGRANIVVIGLLVVGLLCTFVLPACGSKGAFAAVYILIGFVEGIILVATPALVRDFSPQLGRASAMGFWTLGPVFGSLVVSAIISNASDTTTWQHQYTISGIVGLVVFVIAAIGLKELSPNLRDQLMVSNKDREMIEARAKGLDIQESLKKPFRQMLHLDIVGSAVAISLFLVIYYIAVAFFPVFFETVHGYSQSKANGLNNWFWVFDALALILVGFASDRLGVRKPFMVAGAVLSIVFTVIFAIKAADTDTSYGTFRVLFIFLSMSLASAFAPWMASFTETVERRNPALTATGLAVWGLAIRLIIALALFIGPKIVDTVTPLVEKGPAVQAVLADPTPVGSTTIGAVATSASEHPETIAKLQATQGRVGALLAALQAQPAVAEQLTAAAAAGVTPSAAQLKALQAALGPDAFKQLLLPTTKADLAFVSAQAPKDLGAAQFAALSKPTPALTTALGTLSSEGPAVAKAAADSPDQWKTYFLIGAGGQLIFIPLVFLMAGYWRPSDAKRAEADHERFLAVEMEKLHGATPARA